MATKEFNDEIKALRDVDEDQIAIFHHTLGDEIRENWSLDLKDTPLYTCFKLIGITHPDDMSTIIMTCAYRQFNKKPVNMTEQVDKIKAYWQKEIGRPTP